MEILITTLSNAKAQSVLALNQFASPVPTGRPSPVNNRLFGLVDLNENLAKNSVDTYFARVAGTSMAGADIKDGALLVVDRTLTPKTGNIVIASVNGELTCRMLDAERRELRSANLGQKPLTLGEGDVIEGVVVYAINLLPSTGF